MKIKIKYGKGFQTVNISDERIIDIVKRKENSSGLDSINEVKRSLENPINSMRLRDFVKKDNKVVIITSDITRPCPSYIVIPEIIHELSKSGIDTENIEIVFALGSHRKHTEDEMRFLVGDEVFEIIKCVDSDSNNVVHMGETENGTPVDIFKDVAEADIRIGVGNIEFHYFAGYSGGAKAIMPGVSTFEAIQKNHSLMVRDESKTGNCDTNPVRKDIEEAAKYCGLDFIVNVVLNENKEIIKCFSGHYIDAHRQGCKFLDGVYKVKVKRKADIVIVSQGGYPKDINLYQLQKALDNSKGIIEENGIIILVGECIEGFGNSNFEQMFIGSKSPQDIVNKIHKDFQLGGHKAAAISKILLNNEVYLVSDMDENIVRKCFMNPFRNLQDAYNLAKQNTKNGDVIIMPYGGSTLPHI